MTKYISCSALVAGALAFGIAGAQAGTASGTLGVTASVSASCSVSSTPVAFGPVASPIGSTLPIATGHILVDCTAGTPVTAIGLDDGSHSTGSGPAQRQMVGSGSSNNKLAYDLSAVSSGGTTWRSSAGGPSNYQTGPSQDYPVYGQITTTGALAADTYNDTVAITVSF